MADHLNSNAEVLDPAFDDARLGASRRDATSPPDGMYEPSGPDSAPRSVVDPQSRRALEREMRTRRRPLVRSDAPPHPSR